MIEVNLLYDHSVAKEEQSLSQAPHIPESGGTAFKDIFGEDGVEESGSQLEKVFKILLMLSFTGGLYYYERMQIKENRLAISSKQMEVQEAENLLQTKRGVVKNLSELKKRFESETVMIQATKDKLVRRMHFIRGLDFIQTAMVSNLWLTSIRYQKGAFTIDGRTLYKVDLDAFQTNLNKSPFFKRAIIVKDSEVQSVNLGAYEFSIVAETKKEPAGGGA